MAQTLQELVAQLGGGTGRSLAKAAVIAQAVPQFQKQQRVSPVEEALAALGAQWQATQNEQERASLNEAANQTRENFLLNGGSAMELPKANWGADPTKGIQGAGGAFQVGSAGDGLSYGQRAKLAALTGMINGRPTLETQTASAAARQKAMEFALSYDLDKRAADTKDSQFALSYDLDKRATDYSTAKPYFDPNSGSGGAPNQTEVKRIAWSSIMDDMQADVDEAWQAAGDNWNEQTAGAVIDGLDLSYLKNLSAYSMYGITEADMQNISDVVRKRSGFAPKYKLPASSSTINLATDPQ